MLPKFMTNFSNGFLYLILPSQPPVTAIRRSGRILPAATPQSEGKISRENYNFLEDKQNWGWQKLAEIKIFTKEAYGSVLNLEDTDPAGLLNAYPNLALQNYLYSSVR